MKPEMRKMLARESFEEKIRKVGQLIRLAKTFPKHPGSHKPTASIREAAEWDGRRLK
jgi:hypothetical protein